jgi:intraflagellar transport protein 80
VLDRNHDLYVAPANVTNAAGQGAGAPPAAGASLIKIASMVDCAIWHDSTDMLAALSDGKIVTWYYPNVVFVDKELVADTKEAHEAIDFGKTPQFVSPSAMCRCL